MKPMTPMTLPYDIDDPALARATWSRLASPVLPTSPITSPWDTCCPLRAMILDMCKY